MLLDASKIGRTIPWKTLFGMRFKEPVTHPGVFQHETRDIFLLRTCERFAVYRATRRSDVVEETIFERVCIGNKFDGRR